MPIEICEQGDIKALYTRARAGQIPNFTGIDTRYEASLAPESHSRADQHRAEELLEGVVAWLYAN